MADTLTTNLAIALFEQGSHANTWGTDFNAAVTSKLDSCFGDKTIISTTGGDTTLTPTQIQASYINVSGTLSATANLILPLLQKRLIWINNACVMTTAFQLNAKGTGGSSTLIPAGGSLIYWDGTTAAPTVVSAPQSGYGLGIATIASNTTTDLSTTATLNVSVTGTTTITGLGTMPAGSMKFLRFVGALILTHNAVSLILPGAVNLTTAAGTVALALSLGAGNWAILHYQDPSSSPQNATAAEIWAGTTTKQVGVDQMWAAMATVSVAYAATTTIDMATGIHFTVILTGNVTLGFSNAKQGQSGTIRLVQDATGSRVLTLGGAGSWWSDNAVDPVLTAGLGNAQDLLFYTCLSTTVVYVSLARRIS